MEYRQLLWDNLNTLCKQFYKIRWILIDEFLMVGNNMLQFIYLHLQEIRGNIVPFGGISIVCVGDLFQLQPIMQQYIFIDLTSDYGSLATNLWKEHFTIFELTEVMWQKEDKKFAQLWNHLCIGEHTAADINLLKMCIISQEQSVVMSDVPHFFPTRDSTTAYNEAMLKQSSQLTIIVEAMDSPPTDITQNMKIAILAAAKNKDVNSTGNLPFTLTLKVGQLYNVTANLVVSDGIISGVECHIKFIECNPHNLKFPQCVWVQFTDPAIGKEC